MTDPNDDERILGDLPELPEHVWTAALGHAFDPQAEPDVALVPPDDLTGLDAGDDLTFDDLTDDDGHDALDDSHDPVDHGYDGHDPSQHDYHDHGYDDPGFSDTDGYF